MPTPVTALGMLSYGLRLIDNAYEAHRHNALTSRIDQFRKAFGSHPLVYARIWSDLEAKTIDSERQLGWYLITLFWLKKYDTEDDLRNLFGYDQVTIRDWTWYYAECIQELKDYKVGERVTHVCRNNFFI
jgi:hypothetical protein